MESNLDPTHLPNLRIKVATPKESIRAQKAFFALGGYWENTNGFSFTEAPYLFYNGGVLTHSYYWGTNDNYLEISLSELEALVKKQIEMNSNQIPNRDSLIAAVKDNIFHLMKDVSDPYHDVRDFEFLTNSDYESIADGIIGSLQLYNRHNKDTIEP